jgi:predicted PurR-regulated permease PerM
LTSQGNPPNGVGRQNWWWAWRWSPSSCCCLIRFQSFLGPLITAILLAYLINPIAKFACEKIKIPWRLSVTIIYLLLVLIFLGLTTWGGFALVEQIQNLIGFIEKNIFQLPDLVADITEQTYEIGPFTLFTPTGIKLG